MSERKEPMVWVSSTDQGPVTVEIPHGLSELELGETVYFFELICRQLQRWIEKTKKAP